MAVASPTKLAGAARQFSCLESGLLAGCSGLLAIIRGFVSLWPWMLPLGGVCLWPYFCLALDDMQRVCIVAAVFFAAMAFTLLPWPLSCADMVDAVKCHGHCKLCNLGYVFLLAKLYRDLGERSKLWIDCYIGCDLWAKLAMVIGCYISSAVKSYGQVVWSSAMVVAVKC
ncbi:hypothetical protein U1Q18_044428 [Sarracenia purpurea var. burkii]